MKRLTCRSLNLAQNMTFAITAARNTDSGCETSSDRRRTGKWIPSGGSENLTGGRDSFKRPWRAVFYRRGRPSASLTLDLLVISWHLPSSGKVNVTCLLGCGGGKRPTVSADTRKLFKIVSCVEGHGDKNVPVPSFRFLSCGTVTNLFLRSTAGPPPPCPSSSSRERTRWASTPVHASEVQSVRMTSLLMSSETF